VPTKPSPSTRSAKAVQIEPETQSRKGFVKEMSFKSEGRGVTDGESEGGDCVMR